jgi:hypothetical protein
MTNDKKTTLATNKQTKTTNAAQKEQERKKELQKGLTRLFGAENNDRIKIIVY